MRGVLVLTEMLLRITIIHAVTPWGWERYTDTPQKKWVLKLGNIRRT